ncbi:DUF2177 family protein [Aestuariivirga sp.]|uniref:DUF2177 family protein n=1 Tax=Aestuariivirga sp. TaxID=2650926 RepID=UPI0025BC33F6|nr:DUF2177 family protein [Aestuariivirga sp.]MCA3555782.1 DUF2177 family protein [Aestuariivirga sp.]
MTQWIILWIAAAVLFLLIDTIWLLWLGRGFYVSEIGDLLRQPPNMGAAAAFYVLYVTGLMVMVVWPAVQGGSVGQAVLYGSILGLVAYGTYDLTNLAVMKGFTTRIAIIDMVWGTVLTATVSGLTAALGLRLIAK